MGRNIPRRTRTPRLSVGKGHGVPAPGGRRGRRDNGLMASHYDAVGDIDPRVGEHLLDVLANEGIAAYLQPSTDLHPITRTTSLPARPTDRLFVDRAHVTTARRFVRQVSADQADGGHPPGADQEPDDGPPAHAAGDRPGRRRGDAQRRPAGGRRRTDRPVGDPGHQRPADGEPDVDSAWAQIVAGYHLTADPEGAPAGDAITLDEPRFLRDAARDPDAAPEPSLLDALDTFGATLPDDEDEDGYTPPPPPPLPRISTAAGLGVVAIISGLLLFVWPGLLPLGENTVLVLAFALIVAGFGALIWRLRPGDEDDDYFDDGARI